MLQTGESKHSEAVPVSEPHRNLPLISTFLYISLIVPFFGFLGWISATDMMFEHGKRDIWQHAAALKALIENPISPANPFIDGETGSRHFHPLWTGAALVARAIGVDEWAALAAAGYVSLAILATGIFLLARALHPSPWSPLVMFLCLMATWVGPIQHTGFHAPSTLHFAAAYPATFLVGLSFILWAVTLRGLENPTAAVISIPLSAFMFATHQLGAVIGFIGAGCLALFWKCGRWTSSIAMIAAMFAGIAITVFWPYHNPLALLLQPGNSDWEDGPDFYGSVYLAAAFVPSAIGILGLVRKKYLALFVALVAYLAVYLLGLTGYQLAGRFLMPITIVLQLGLGIYILDVIHAVDDRRGEQVLLGIIAAAVVCFHVIFPTDFGMLSPEERSTKPNLYLAAQTLTDDIPDVQEVAAHPNAVWPMVATGQKTLSIPWPEPLIHDLAERQATTAALFATDMSADDRIALARMHGVRSLIARTSLLPEDVLTALQDQSVSIEISGPLIRFDLYD
jgi:hypothetical protein